MCRIQFKVEAPTAGDLLRRATESGTPTREIARLLSGKKNPTHEEIEKWRAVVVRAQRGVEPSKANAAAVGKAFKQKVADRQPRATQRRELEARQAAIEAEVAWLVDGMIRIAQAAKVKLPPRAQPEETQADGASP